jgi:hypothetical protein
LWERVARIAICETGEGFVPVDSDPSSSTDCVHATFSNKRRREGIAARLRGCIGYREKL